MNRIKDLRTKKGLTQKQLAIELNITQGTLSGWETERYSLGNDEIRKLTEYFDVSADYLLGISETKQTKPQDEDIAKIVAIYRRLTPDEKVVFMNLLKSAFLHKLGN